MPNPKTVTPPIAPPPAKTSGRKPWKPRGPLEVMRDQHEKLRKDVLELEEQLEGKRKQLTKFEEAMKVLEAS